MARIVIIQHETELPSVGGYWLGLLAAAWRERGHEVLVPVGLQALPEADVAILHVNQSVVPSYYVELAGHYPKLLNARALDIRKRTISRNLVGPGDDWDGPVIVKTDLNSSGTPERVVALRAERKGKLAVGHPPAPIEYQILPGIAAVPDEVWSNRHLVVERFLPEREGDTYHLRTWLFFGDRERSVRSYGDQPIVKGTNIRGRDEIPVPDAMRTERERLGFDFGKLDWVMHDGEPVLLDANKTPSQPPPSPRTAANIALLAEGIESFTASAPKPASDRRSRGSR